jgi:hypothetical protein
MVVGSSTGQDRALPHKLAIPTQNYRFGEETSDLSALIESGLSNGLREGPEMLA